MILVPILHYSSTLHCWWARLCVSQLLNIFETLFISRALIWYRRDREHLLGRSLSDLTVHKGRWPGRRTLIKHWNEPEGFFFSAVLGWMLTEQTRVNFVIPYCTVMTPCSSNGSTTRYASSKGVLLKAAPPCDSSACTGDDGGLLSTVLNGATLRQNRYFGLSDVLMW